MQIRIGVCDAELLAARDAGRSLGRASCASQRETRFPRPLPKAALLHRSVMEAFGDEPFRSPFGQSGWLVWRRQLWFAGIVTDISSPPPGRGRAVIVAL
jgi:hypothetical protein